MTQPNPALIAVLQESLRLRQVYAQSTAAIERIQAEGHIQDASDAYVELWRWDVESWAKAMFPELCTAEFSPFHEAVFQIYRESICYDLPGRIGRRDVIAAPRGNAKSSVATFLCNVHAICYGIEKYIVIFASTARQAVQRTRNIRDALIENENIREVYGLLCDPKAAEQAFTANGVRVEGYGMRDATRGLNFEGQRPTRVCLDDVEDDDEATSLLVRERIRDKYRRVVDAIGAEHTNFMAVGTIIYPDSLLVELLDRADYRGLVFRSIEAEPENGALWAECRAIYMNRRDPDREAKAVSFYRQNRRAMDKGARVLWPAWESLFKLMTMRWTMGDYAFRSEKQNEPVNPALIVIKKEWFRYYDGQPPHGCAWYLFGDPAFSKRHTADEAALATMAVDPDGYYYVHDCEADRYGPAEYVNMLFQRIQMLQDRHGDDFKGAFLEQLEYLRDWIQRHMRENKMYFNLGELQPVKGEGPDAAAVGTPKRRIKAVIPHYQAGVVLHHAGLKGSKVEEQLLFPAGEHDDAADVVAYGIKYAQAPQRESGKKPWEKMTPAEQVQAAIDAEERQRQEVAWGMF